MQLREYQHRIIYDELLLWFANNPEGHPIVSACVGAGKSLMIAELCRHAVQDYTDQRSRMLILVPSKELLEQNAQKLIALAPSLKIGIISASLGRKDTGFDKDVVLATVGSIIKNPGSIGRIDLVLIDECHLVNRKETGQYRKLITALTAFNPALRVIGWTGTPFRGNGILLTEGEERLFTDIAASVSMTQLLDDGFLSPLIPGKPRTQISADNIKVDSKTGDYRINDLAAMLDNSDTTSRVADEIVELGSERKKWMVFCVTVSHATHMLEALTERGIKAALVTGETPKPDRERTIAAFRAGRYRALVNVAVLTTGFDVPDVDLLALVRNTQSPVLYTQIAGRGMRIAEGKDNCLWLDFTDTTLRLGPIDRITGREEPKPKPKEEHQASNSGPRGMKVHGHSNGADILSMHGLGYWYIHILKTTYRSHQKKGSDNYILRVDYWSGMRIAATEWVCFEHTGYARTKAEKWWKQRYIGHIPIPVPESVVEALCYVNQLRTPERILVRNTEKYPEIINVEFTKEEESA